MLECRRPPQIEWRGTMNLYEIDQAILELVDPETGEITDFGELDRLMMERNRKIENVACWIKNLASDAAELKSEEAALNERRKKKESQILRLKRYLSDALQGEKFETSKCAVSFRRSSAVSVTDPAMIARWALENGNQDVVIQKTEISKTALRNLLKSGVSVDGAELVENISVGVK